MYNTKTCLKVARDLWNEHFISGLVVVFNMISIHLSCGVN